MIRTMIGRRPTQYFILLILSLILSGCWDFNNPADPRADNYQGFREERPDDAVGFALLYDGNGQSSGTVPVDPTLYQQGDTAIVLGRGTISRVNSSFGGWNTANDGSGTHFNPGDLLSMPAADQTLYTEWGAATTYTVTYNGNLPDSGTVPVDDFYYIAGETATLPPNSGGLTKAGFTFTGWNTQSDGLGIHYNPGDTPAITANLLLYAEWTALPTYTVTYDAHGGINPPAPSGGHLDGASVSVAGPGAMTNAGFSFLEWNTASDGSGTSYDPGDSLIIPAMDVTLWAQWTALPTYSVSYNANGGVNPPVDGASYLDGDPVTVSGPAGMSNSGFGFVEWNTLPGGGGTSYNPADIFNIAGVNVTLYAIWDPVYSVSYFGNGEDGGAPPTDGNAYFDGEPVTVLGNTGGLTKSGHSFNGWNTLPGGGGTSYIASDVFNIAGADVDLHAQWTALPTFTLSYDANGGVGAPAPSGGHLSGANITVNDGTGLSRAGFQFKEWNTAADGSGMSYAALSTYTIFADDTLYAMWDELFTITYLANGGDGGSAPSDANNYIIGDTPNVLANSGGLFKTGHTFDRWNTNSAGTGTDYLFGAPITVTGDINLYAKYVPISFTLTYDANGATSGTVPTGPTSHDYNSLVTVLDNTGGLVNPGLAFNGWNTAADGSGTGYTATDTFNMPAANITLYAQWIPVFAGGDGSPGTPYLIDNPAGLDAMRNNLTAYYEMISDINLDVFPWNTGSGWEPIGSSTNQFEGSFNGNGYTISNLMINRTSTGVGFFSYIENATISNVRLENVDITNGNNNTGGLAGAQQTAASTVTNCYVTGTITSSGYNNGGLVGYSANGDYYRCYADVDVSSGDSAGGLVGFLASGSVTDSYAIGTVSGGDQVGGLVGRSNGSVATSYAAVKVSGTANLGGLVGLNAGIVNSSYYDVATSGMSDTGKGNPLLHESMTQQTQFAGLDFATVWQIDEGISFPYLQWQGALNIPTPQYLLASRWDFNAGSELYDETGRGNDLTVDGGSPTFGNLITHRYLQFSGDGDRLAVITSPELDTVMDGQSVSFWIFDNLGFEQGTFVSRYTSTNQRVWGIGPQLAGQINVMDNAGYVGGGVFSLHGSFNAGSWNHVVVVYDLVAAETRMYVNNGPPTIRAALDTTFFNQPGTVYLGDTPAGTSAGSASVGPEIADIRIFNYALTSYEVDAIYNE